MGAVASVLVVAGIIALIYSIMERAKAGRVNKTPFVKTGQAAATSGDVSVEGNVVCPQPLVAPFSGAPCLYYSIKCTAEWKDGDKHKSKEISSDKVAAPFSIDDGSGPVAVDAAKGGTFDPTQTKRETKGTGLMGGITGKELMFGQYVVSTGALSLGTKYKVEEEILPMQSRLYVNGTSQGGSIVTPSGLRSLLISSKPRDALLASALKGSKFAMLGGIGALVVGGGVGAASKLMAPSDGAEAPAANAAAVAAPEALAAPAAPAATPAEPQPAAADPAVPAMKMEDLKTVSPAKKTGASAAAAVTAGGAAVSSAKVTATASPGATTAPTAASPGATTAPTAASPKAAASSPTAAPTAAAPKAGSTSKAKPASSK